MKWNASLNIRNANRYVLIKLFSGTAFIQYRSYQKFRLVKKMKNNRWYTLHYTTHVFHVPFSSLTSSLLNMLKHAIIAKHTIKNLSIFQTRSISQWLEIIAHSGGVFYFVFVVCFIFLRWSPIRIDF